MGSSLLLLSSLIFFSCSRGPDPARAHSFFFLFPLFLFPPFFPPRYLSPSRHQREPVHLLKEAKGVCACFFSFALFCFCLPPGRREGRGYTYAQKFYYLLALLLDLWHTLVTAPPSHCGEEPIEKEGVRSRGCR
ncbi:hypothetical protein TRSC58_07240 [Trypanosoma rangeli SC58]|uniref:Secreted protein n=1 Tax=Trypanosoma rangeli SC58 TaxID=429131 RepID=A0A061IVW1_TRYRA|nr:hypothetical protein TRSC58_07240 [Trypanosoma rangeli SC58]